jgi:GntR family transcriptional regulator/MocR family aminotransferase
VLADFMLGGHYERHLRRVRAAYRERLEALEHAAERRCAGALRLRPVKTGLHGVADLVDADARRVHEAAARRGVEVMPLADYYFGRSQPQNALVLGFGGVRADSLDDGMQRLAAAIVDARRGAAPANR